MSLKVNNHTVENCFKISISFKTTEGLNKFTEFLFQKGIKGLGFESSEKNRIYSGIFNEKETDLIKEYLEKTQQDELACK